MLKWLLVAACVSMASQRRVSSRVLSTKVSQKEKRSYVLDIGDRVGCDGDKCECYGLDEDVILQRKIGEGAWGAVFQASNEASENKYAVKVQTRKNYSDFSEYKDYVHECSIMRELTGVPDLHVPRCLALCKEKEMDVFVMDLVPSVGDLKGIADLHLSDAAISKLSQTVYSNIVAMLELGINNVDQRDVNILAESDGTAHFIDMGMASREAEIFDMCKKGSKFSTLKVLEPALGDNREACRFHIDALNTGFISSALRTLPKDSLPAMQGLTDAFCKNPSSDLTHAQYWTVEVDESDMKFKKALTGEEKIIVKKGKGWFKTGDDRLIAIKSFKGYKQNYDIPDGAELVAVMNLPTYGPMTLAEGRAQLGERTGWGRFDTPPTDEGNVGTFVFVKPGIQLMKDAVKNVLSYARLEEKPKLLKQVDSCS